MTGKPMHTASKEKMAPRTPVVNYCLKSEIPIMLRCQLYSTHYAALQIKNYSKSTSAVKVATMKIWTISVMNGSHHVLPSNRHLSPSAMMNETQKRTLVSP